MKLSEMSNENRNVKILVYGESGTGKTCFGIGFPTPIYCADFDGKISSASNYFSDAPEQLSGVDYDRYLPSAGFSGRDAIDKFNSKLDEIANSENPPRTFMLDSLTMFAEQLMQWVIEGNPGMKGVKMGEAVGGKTIPSQQHYRVLNIIFGEFITKMLSLPCHVVMTGHQDQTKDELTGRIYEGPLLSGKLKAKIPVLFEEVFRTYVDKGNFYAQTVSDHRFSVRCQTKGVPNPMPLSYEELAKCL